VIDVARRSGIRSRLDPVASLPLGTHELSLLELTAAYAPFANGGYRARPFGLLEVRTSDGALLYRYQSPVDTRVAGRRVVRDMNRMLTEAVQAGTGRAAQLPDRQTAGKTGTSQNASDAWFIGYTAELVAGVWMGNDDNASMGRMTGGRLPARIWAATMAAVHPLDAPASLPYTDSNLRSPDALENLIVRALDESPRPDIYIPGGAPEGGIMRLNPDRR
jgi:penicillin-binding protein 1A